MKRLRVAGIALLLTALGAVGTASAQEPNAPPKEGRLMEMFLDQQEASLLPMIILLLLQKSTLFTKPPFR